MANSLFAASSVSAGSAKNITTTKAGKSASSCPVYSPGKSYSSGQCVADMDHLFISLGNVPKQVPTPDGLSPPNYPLNRNWLILERPATLYKIKVLASQLCKSKANFKKWMIKLQKSCAASQIDPNLLNASLITSFCSLAQVNKIKFEEVQPTACAAANSLTTVTTSSLSASSASSASSLSNSSTAIVDKNTQNGSPLPVLSLKKEEQFNEDGDVFY